MLKKLGMKLKLRLYDTILTDLKVIKIKNKKLKFFKDFSSVDKHQLMHLSNPKLIQCEIQSYKRLYSFC